MGYGAMGNVHGGKGCVGGGSHVGSWGQEGAMEGHGAMSHGCQGVEGIGAMGWSGGGGRVGRVEWAGMGGGGRRAGRALQSHLIGAWGHGAMGSVHGKGVCGWWQACGILGHELEPLKDQNTHEVWVVGAMWDHGCQGVEGMGGHKMQRESEEATVI